MDRVTARRLGDRIPGPGHSVRVHGTPSGGELGRSVLAARRRALAAALTGLDSADPEGLAGVLQKVLPPLVIDPGPADLICRLCDFDACPSDRCPVHERQREMRQP